MQIIINLCIKAFSMWNIKFSASKAMFFRPSSHSHATLSTERVKTFNWENSLERAGADEEEPQSCDKRLNHYLHKTHNYVMSEYCFQFLAGGWEKEKWVFLIMSSWFWRNKSESTTWIVFSFMISFGLTWIISFCSTQCSRFVSSFDKVWLANCLHFMSQVFEFKVTLLTHTLLFVYSFKLTFAHCYSYYI